MSQSKNKTGKFLPPPHILANVTLKSINLETQIAIHWLVVDKVRFLADRSARWRIVVWVLLFYTKNDYP